jgi:uncharacterized protein
MSDVLAAKYALRSIPYQNSFMIDICDLQLIGTRLEENGLVIDLAREYYQQEIVGQSRAQEMLQKCKTASLVGNQIVNLAIAMRMAQSAGIRMISGVPFLMIYKFQNS